MRGVILAILLFAVGFGVTTLVASALETRAVNTADSTAERR
jgi:hypothetical protein